MLVGNFGSYIRTIYVLHDIKVGYKVGRIAGHPILFVAHQHYVGWQFSDAWGLKQSTDSRFKVNALHNIVKWLNLTSHQPGQTFLDGVRTRLIRNFTLKRIARINLCRHEAGTICLIANIYRNHFSDHHQWIILGYKVGQVDEWWPHVGSSSQHKYLTMRNTQIWIIERIYCK